MPDQATKIALANRHLQLVRDMRALERDLIYVGEQPWANIVRLGKLELISPAIQGPFNDLPINSSDLRP